MLSDHPDDHLSVRMSPKKCQAVLNKVEQRSGSAFPSGGDSSPTSRTASRFNPEWLIPQKAGYRHSVRAQVHRFRRSVFGNGFLE